MPGFSGGFKIDGYGRRWRQARAETNVSSNGVTKYTTILWEDGTASCDCPGWTMPSKDRRARGVRECSHTVKMSGRTKDWPFEGGKIQVAQEVTGINLVRRQTLSAINTLRQQQADRLKQIETEAPEEWARKAASAVLKKEIQREPVRPSSGRRIAKEGEEV